MEENQQGMIDKYVGTIRVRAGLEPETLLYLFIALSMAGWVSYGGILLIRNVFTLTQKTN